MEIKGVFVLSYIDRFVKVQDCHYTTVLVELKNGKKVSHWMWYIFPQLRGLAKSRKAFVFGIVNTDEAREYLSHPQLGTRLVTCCETLLTHKDKTAEEILGDLDAKKLRSSMTLFASISEENSIFHKVLNQFYDGQTDPLTNGLISGSILDMATRKYAVGVEW